MHHIIRNPASSKAAMPAATFGARFVSASVLCRSPLLNLRLASSSDSDSAVGEGGVRTLLLTPACHLALNLRFPPSDRDPPAPSAASMVQRATRSATLLIATHMALLLARSQWKRKRNGSSTAAQAGINCAAHSTHTSKSSFRGKISQRKNSNPYKKGSTIGAQNHIS